MRSLIPVRLLPFLVLTLVLLAYAWAGPVVASGPSATQPDDDSEIPAEEAAIRDVIRRTNEQQAVAIATGDPSVMRETATDRHYREMVENNDNLRASGVTRIELVGLEWGQITVQGTRAEATTFETWMVTTPTGRLLVPPERNLYRLVQEDGVWKVDANEHPDEPLPLPVRPAQT